MKNLLKLLLLSVLLILPIFSVNAEDLGNRLSGKILLQVESEGQAWYIEPTTQERAFLGRPDDAFRIMRELGLGIKHIELEKYLNSEFPDKLSGKIMLDVEANGEAYYISPDDLKGYYLGRPNDAFGIMREMGLGITNNDLEKVPVFQKYAEQTETNTQTIKTIEEKLKEQQDKIVELEKQLNANSNNHVSTSTQIIVPNPISISKVDIVYSNSGLSTKTFYVNSGQAIQLSVSNNADFESALLKFQNDDLSSVIVGVSAGSTRSITFNAPSSEGEYIYYNNNVACVNGAPVFGKMIVTDSSTNSSSHMNVETPLWECTTVCTSWTYSDWTDCSSSGQQSRNIISSLPTNCSGGSPLLSQSCSYSVPTCTSWTYSDWTDCSSSGQQSRNIISSLPTNCSGGSPLLSQSCSYVNPCSCSDVNKECCDTCEIGDSCGGGVLVNKNPNIISAPIDCTTTNTCPIQESRIKNWNYAISTCQNLSTNNYYDWHLPTLTELDFVYQYRINYNLDFLVAHNHWSSTSYDNNNGMAWLQNCSSLDENYHGGNQAVATKDSTLYARCVRSFN